MEDFFIAIFVFSILSLLFGGSVLGITSFVQVRKLRKELRELKGRAPERPDGWPRQAPLAPPETAPEASAEPATAEREELASPAPAATSPVEEAVKEPSSAERAAIERVPEKRAEQEGLKESAPERPAKKRIEWEKLLGVQGAAILGGVVLLFTAILFFKYAIDEGWFTREARVWTGLAAGSLCMLLQARLRGRGYKVVADVLAGSGAVIHYTSAWAGFRLYHLFTVQVGFGWMALVTVACCWLAVRHSAQLIAIFGLVGGFATPLLLATAAPSAVGLFGYILLLDMALLAIGRRQDWPWLGLLGLFGTTASQVLWLISGREEEAALGLVACGLFGVLFVFLGSPKAALKDLRWQLGRIAGIMIPFAIAIYYAQLVELGDDFLVITCVTTLLAGAATYVGRRLELHGMSIAAAAAAAAVASTWLLSRTLDEAALTSFALLTGTSSIIIAIIDARTRGDRDPGELHPASIYSVVLLFAFTYTVAFDVGLSLWGVLLTLGVHLALTILPRASLPALPTLAGLAAGATFLMYRVQQVHPGNPYFHSAPVLQIGVAVFSGALLCASLRWHSHPSPRALALAAMLTGAPSLLFNEDWYSATPPSFYGALSLLALIVAWGAARTGSSIAYGAAAAVICWAFYSHNDPGFYESREWSIPVALLWIYLGTAIATLAPLLAKEQLLRARATGLIAALVPALGASSILSLHEYHYGDRGALLVFIVLAALPALAYKLVGDDVEAEMKRAKTSYLLIAGALLGFAIPAELRMFHLQLLATADTLWLLIGLSIAAASAALVAKLRESAATSISAHFAVFIVSVFLCFIPFHLEDLLRQENLVINWISYVFGVALLSTLFVMSDGSLMAKLDSEASKYLKALTGAGACLISFSWLNLLLINGYSDGDYLDISSADLNRDLVLSLSWALYSFSLLALGARRGVAAMRWASLAFLFATIVKVFLFDLGNLEGLQRVGSFLGLAICLILVSLFYSRFVFKKTDEAEAST